MTAAVDLVLGRLELVKRNGAGWTARCPAHDDRNPSLTVAEGDDGRALVTCHGGCSLDAILSALDLGQGDLFEPRSNGARTIAATYDYVDEAGEPLFQAVRFEPKGFAQRRPDGRGGWTWGLGEVRRVLFRLPQVLDAVRVGETVWVAEGEKDVLALERAGVACATCNPMGAGKWRNDYADSLSGADVVVVADRDEAGRAHAETIRRSLETIARAVRVVEPSVGKDVSDHLAAGVGLGEFVPVPETDVGTPPAIAAVAPFAGRSHAEVIAMAFPEEESAELIEGLAPRGVLMNIAGLPETYKGWLAAAISVGVAEGKGIILGCEVAAQGSVGYFWQDDSTRNEAERVQLYARVRETPADLPLRWFLNEDLRLPRDMERLRVTIEEHGFSLVVLDSLYNVVVGLDLKDTVVGELYSRLKAEICDPTGCTVLVVDHMPWATDSNRRRLRGYGDVFKNAAVRAGIYIDVEGSKLWVEARGNNIKGFRRTPAYWDGDALELRLVEVTREVEDETDAKVLAYVEAHPASARTEIVTNSGMAKTRVRNSLERLVEGGAVLEYGRPRSGRTPATTLYFSSIHAAQVPPDLFGAVVGGTAVEAPVVRVPPVAPVPRRGGGTRRGRTQAGVDQDEIERLARIAREAVALVLPPAVSVGERRAKRARPRRIDLEAEPRARSDEEPT